MKNNILGIWDGHDSGIAVLSPDSIVLAVNEERFTGRKLEVEFPVNSLKTVTETNKFLEAAYSTTDFSKTLARYFPSIKEQYYLLRRRKISPGFLSSLTKTLKYKTTKYGTNSLYKLFSDINIKHKLSGISPALSQVRSHEHHWCHLCSAAFTAGQGDRTVISLDGVGDGRSGAVAELRNGKLNLISSIDAETSIGIFFEHITNLLNMRELEDEGKVMALADFSYRVEDTDNPLFDFIWTDGLKLNSSYSASKMYGKLKKIFHQYPSEQFSYMAQRVLESCVTKLVDNAVKKTGISDIAYSGGVAANVKANMQINEMRSVNKMHVFPHMGDGGLAMGAALASAYENWGTTYYNLGNSFLGNKYSRDEIEKFFKSKNIDFIFVENIEEKAAELICNGEIIPYYTGRMEYGPRALGNRSILALPGSLEIKNRLNLLLKKRVYYQPFCPSILESDAEKILSNTNNFNPYMTIAFRVRKEYLPALQGVINIDGTCRPQILPDDSDISIARILRAVKKKNGLGVLLNTSLNIHGYPIARTPAEALKVFTEMNVNYGVMDKFLIS